MREVSICAACRHLRQKPSLDPFRHISVWTPEQVKLQAEWQKQNSEITLQENHRFRSGDEFDYEPETLPWCQAWTEKDAGIIDPVTGKRLTVYALCARKNSRGDCSLYQEK